MQVRSINSIYRQFYIADLGLSPAAPEVWTGEHIAQRHNSQKHIVALCPEGDVSARLVLVPPGSVSPQEGEPDFEVITQICIDSGKLAVLEWPWEVVQEFEVVPGWYQIKYSGYDTNLAGTEGDHYVVEFVAT